MIALELAGVSKRYGLRRALERVNLALPAGAAVGLLGPNGAGKTRHWRAGSPTGDICQIDHYRT